VPDAPDAREKLNWNPLEKSDKMESLVDDVVLLILVLVADLRATSLACKRLCRLGWPVRVARFRAVLNRTEHINGDAAIREFLLPDGRLPLILRTIERAEGKTATGLTKWENDEHVLVGPWITPITPSQYARPIGFDRTYYKNGKAISAGKIYVKDIIEDERNLCADTVTKIGSDGGMEHPQMVARALFMRRVAIVIYWCDMEMIGAWPLFRFCSHFIILHSDRGEMPAHQFAYENGKRIDCKRPLFVKENACDCIFDLDGRAVFARELYERALALLET
jgi:hypothetical protein